MKNKSRRWLSFLLALCMLLTLPVASAGAVETAPHSDISITDMQTNSRMNPIGLDDATPVFSWKMQSNEIGAAQSAYQIVVTDPQNEIVWNSGKVDSGMSTDIHYAGNDLSAQTAYEWSLTVWDQNGNPHPAGTASFETGLMDPSKDAWNGAEWIGTNDFFLDAETMKNFEITFDMQLQEGSTKAGVVYGANDPRMQNYTKNKWLIEGETYIYVELDISGVLDDDPDTAAKINIYRKGFCADDYAQPDNTTVFSLELKNNILVSTEDGDFVLDNDAGITKENAYDKHSFSLKTSGSGGLSITLDGTTLNYVNHVLAKDKSWSYKKQNLVIINPNHATGDVNCYPLLNEIGFCAPAGNEATINGYTIKNTSLGYDVFGVKTGATYSIWDGMDGIAIQDGQITISGGTDGTLFYANPTYGSIPYLRNEFKVEKEVASARLYATAWGNYELYLNGERFGDDYLSPGYTQLNVTLNYMTYDITDALKSGDNAIGFILSNGWLYDHGWNRTPALMAMMEITYTDGSVQHVVTDENWQISTDTPVRAATFWQGEKYDATMDAAFSGWSAADYDANGWDYATVIVPTSTPDLVGKMDEPVKVIEERSATLLDEQKGADAQTYIYDLGVNMVGTVKIKLPQMQAGTKLMFRYAEVLYPQLDEDNQYYYGDLTGRIAVENLRAAYCTDYYICSGAQGGEEITFSLTYHGFRYLEITGLDTPLPAENITGLVLSSIDDQSNTYESSNELANQYFKNIMRSLWGNFVSIPTDCNQRDERQGWTGDAQVFSKTATYFGDVSSFYESWMSSARDSQALSGGSIGNTFPSSSSGTVQPYDETKISTNGLCWSAAAIIVPWNTYLQYGNKTILEDNYELMRSFTNGLCREGNLMEGSQYLINGGGLAEHLAFETTNPNFIQNAMFYRLLVIMEKVATIMGDDTSAAKYADRSEHVKAEWNEVFVDPETGKTHASPVYNNQLQDTQASYTIPIAYGIVSEENLQKMLPNMLEAMQRGNVGKETADGGMTEPSGVFGTQGSFYQQGIPYTITTGFTGTPTVLPALTQTGQIDVAYKMFEQTEFSSWLCTVTLGATSIWERWNAQTAEDGFNGQDFMNSFNHYASGAVGEWMMGYQAGITNDEENPGYKHFVLQPTPGGSYTFLNASYDCAYGEIVSNWTAEEGKMNTYETVVPANTTATLYLPVEASDVILNTTGATYLGDDIHNGQICAKFELQAGGYNFSIDNGVVTVDVAEGYMDDSAPVKSVTAPESAQVNENFTITVVTSSDVTDVRLYNANDMAIGRKGINVIDNGDGTQTWSITVALGTVGDGHVIRVMTRDASNVFIDSGMSVSINITSIPPMIGAFDLPDTGVVNRTFIVQATTDLSATKIEVYNETGMKMGLRSLTSKTVDGQKVWTGVMSIGTQGERMFSCYAVNKYGARSEALADNIAVRAFA